MSASDDGSDYKVGPGKPPLKDRFVSGRSGNPKGRPRKPKAAGVDELSLTELILAESKRSLTLTEGGQPITLPAAQAVLRALLVTAGKGNAHAQRTFLKLTFDAEARKQKARSEALNYALRLKLDIEDVRNEFVATGGDEWKMAVHPSDIEINGLTGEVKCFIALTDEQRNARVTLLNQLATGHAVLERSAATIAEDGDDALLKLGRELAVIKILFANELLPARMRREVPPQFTVSAELAAQYLDLDWTGAQDLRSTLARKLGAGP